MILGGPEFLTSKSKKVLFFKDILNSKIAFNLTVILLIGILVFCTFHQALDNNFIFWDDQYYVTENPLITNPNWKSFKTLQTEIISLNYHPLTMVSLWLNAYFSGTDSAHPYIITNLIIHILSGWLCFLFIYELTNENLFLAAFTSIVFCIHPMHVESVVWVSERKDVLYGFFFLCSTLLYLKYTKTNNPKFYWLSLVAFIFSCLSKAMAVCLVGILFLIDYLNITPKKHTQSPLKKLPFIFIGILIGLIALNVQSGQNFYGLLSNNTHENAMAFNLNLSIIDKINNLIHCLNFYFNSFLFPNDHSAFHPYDFESIGKPLNILGLTLLLLLSLNLIIIRPKWLIFSLSYFLITIVLVLQIIPVGSAIVSERYTYLPYIGLAFGAATLIEKLKIVHQFFPAFCSLVICAALGLSSYHQAEMWDNHTKLFTQVVSVYPHNSKARKYLATGYWKDGKHSEVINQVKYILDTLSYEDSALHDLLANVYTDVGNTALALSHYNRAIELDSLNITAIYHRGLLNINLDPFAAIQDFDICEKTSNLYVKKLIYSPRARCHGKIGNYKLAIQDFSLAIENSDELIANYQDRALTYELFGDYNAALEDYKKTFALGNTNPRVVEAIQRLEKIVK